MQYLEGCNLKDIVVVPTRELGLKHLAENSIVTIGFSSKHIYKSAKDLTVEIKGLNIPNISEKNLIYGRRDEEWLLVEVGPEISIYFVTQDFRKDFDLVEMWINRPTEEDINRNNRLKDVFYKKKFK